MNIPQTMVALMTLATESEEVTMEMAEQVQELLAGASRMELEVLIASLANVNNYALELLEQQSDSFSREEYLRDLGQTIALDDGPG